MIEVKNLTVEIPNKKTHVPLKDLSICIPKNQIFGLMGESGSGKTMTALSIMSLLKRKIPHAKIKGCILYDNQDLLKTPEKNLQKIRGKKISMIFQNPFTFFNPSFQIQKQFDEISNALSSSRIQEVLKAVQLHDEHRILSSYPHQLSGGQLQRLMIAISILHHPEVLIADEPTTALDPTIKASILNLLKKLKENYGLTLFIISHDIPYVSKICDQMAVIYRGYLLETAPAKELLNEPLHPYTQELLNIQNKNTSEMKNKSLKFNTEQGCPYTDRCPHAKSICANKLPPFYEYKNGHLVQCWLYEN